MISEDLPDNQLLIEAFLKPTLHELVFAEDGKLAVERFKESSYDLIFMDMQMPIMDGIAATRAIRELRGDRLARTSFRVRCPETGFWAIDPPWSPRVYQSHPAGTV